MLLETLQDRQYILWTIFSRNGNYDNQLTIFFMNSLNVKILWSIRLANVLQKASIFVGFQMTY